MFSQHSQSYSWTEVMLLSSLLLWPHNSQLDFGLHRFLSPAAPRSEPIFFRSPSTWSLHRIRGLRNGLISSGFSLHTQDLWIDPLVLCFSLFSILHFSGLAQKSLQYLIIEDYQFLFTLFCQCPYLCPIQQYWLYNCIHAVKFFLD